MPIGTTPDYLVVLYYGRSEASGRQIWPLHMPNNSKILLAGWLLLIGNTIVSCLVLFQLGHPMLSLAGERVNSPAFMSSYALMYLILGTLTNIRQN